jgi:hypothetical protein
MKFMVLRFCAGRVAGMLLLAACLLSAGSAAGLSAQSPSSQPGRQAATRAVTVVMVDDARYGTAPAVILLRTGSEPQNVVILRAGRADARDLSGALLGIAAADHSPSAGGRTDGEVLYRVAAAQPDAVFPWASRMVEYLGRADAREVPGVGTYPALKIWIPVARQAR